MKRYQKPIWILILGMAAFVVACVTVNIYFPAEKVESVAGEIVDEIRGQEGSEEETSLNNTMKFFFQETVLALSPSMAWAEEVTTVTNPTIRATKQRMKNRYSQMKPYFQKRLFTEGDNGYVILGDTSGLGLKEKRDLKGLMDAENNDRETLYAEVAKALKIDASQINKIEKIFAKQWQESVR